MCRTWVILLVIMLSAAVLRLVKLGQLSPPGLYQDEAANAWSAYCLLKTGKDYAGVSWPIYYTRNVGGNSSTLYVYMLLPFQALGGMNIFTTRLPAAVLSIFNVWLIYFVAKRLFNTQTGLVAAALLTFNPWSLQLSRWGHEASINPLLGLAPLALMLWAGMPISDNKTITPRPVIAALGGILSGIGCFSYHSVRIFVPVFLLAAFLLTFPEWKKSLKTHRGVWVALAFLIFFAAIFGQLVYLHIFHPEGIGRHVLYQGNWVGSATFSTAIKEAAYRYIKHFGLDFLFIRGDNYIMQHPPVGGQFHWYELPLMLAGLPVLFSRFKKSASARVLLAYILAYPVGDSLSWGLVSIDSLRSAPGLCSLVLLSALGAVEAAVWLWKRKRNLAPAVTVVFSLAVILMNIRYFYHFYGEFNRRPEVCRLFHTDLVEACQWLRPRLDNFDAVFCTTKGFDMPYIITTVVLDYDPKRWFSEPIDFTTPGEWDIYTRYGKMYFMYKTLPKQSAEKYRPDRLLFIIRPDEIDPRNPSLRVIHKIIRPDGKEVLLICQP